MTTMRKALFPEDHPWRRGSFGGDLERLLGHYATAESLLTWGGGMLGARDTLMAGANYRIRLGELYRDTGRLPEAEIALRGAVNIMERHVEPDHIDLAEGRIELARVLRMTGKLDEADSLCGLAEGPLVSRLGPSHWKVGDLQGEEAEILLARSRPREAEPLFRRSLATLKGQLHDDHWRVTRCRIRLAACLAALDRHAEADSLFQAGLAHLDRMPDAERRLALQTAERLHLSTLPAGDRGLPVSRSGR